MGNYKFNFINSSENHKIIFAEGPKWIGEIQSKTLLCQSKLDKDELIGLTFYPNWPAINPHTYRLTEPTTNEISCWFS